MKAFLPPIIKGDSIESAFARFIGEEIDSEVMNKIKWLGLFTDETIELPKATPAFILQKLLEKKWLLKPGEKDMIIMQHLFDYELSGKKMKLTSTLVVKGDDEVDRKSTRLNSSHLGISY